MTDMEHDCSDDAVMYVRIFGCIFSASASAPARSVLLYDPHFVLQALVSSGGKSFQW